mmetsp:Transcript_3564/g.4559  ORF Transcript_3564/g.4559 Transcript_3564/m.4559 type:complete len:131 (+) Transcript_3564:545-937(+)
MEAVENYFTPLEDVRRVSPYAVEVIVFPFHAGDSVAKNKNKKEDCTHFDRAAKKGNRPIHIMETIEINGPKAHPVYRYFKKMSGIKKLDVDQPTFFLVNAAGNQVDYYIGATISRFLTLLRVRLLDYEEL